MGDRTGIEWTDATWNPTTGCDQVSPGCDNCYALGMAKRLKAMGSPGYQQDGDTRTSGPGFALQVHEDRLDQPLRWTKPRRIFVNSMSDLFHPRVPDEFIARVFAVMSATPRHTFQVLTKRPKRMRSLLRSDRFMAAFTTAALEVLDGARSPWPVLPLPNVWLGTSVEDQQRADERVVQLLWTPAAVRFLSCEPLLGPVHLGEHLLRDRDGDDPLLDWVIVGGESGPGARPMHPEWARSLRVQCTAAGVPFLFKQWGAWVQPHDDFGPDPTRWLFEDGRWCAYGDVAGFRRLINEGAQGHGVAVANVGKHAAGRELDGWTWDEMPDSAEVAL